MPAFDPLSHAPSVMPGQTGSQILRCTQNDRGGRNNEGRRDDGGHAMNMHGIIPGFPLPDNKCRGSKFTNEVQHLAKVLSWEPTITTSPLKTDVTWPVYTPTGARSGKSRQLWIARHQPWLAR